MIISRRILRNWRVCRPSFRWFGKKYGNKEIEVDAEFIKAAMEQDSAWILILLNHAKDPTEASFIEKTSGWKFARVKGRKKNPENNLFIAYLGDPNSKKIKSFLECMGVKG